MRLGYAPLDTVKKTIDATTQFIPSVEAETREILRDHFMTRSYALKLTRLKDLCYTDTFFSSVKSIRGYKCFQLYAFAPSGFDTIYLLRRRNQNVSTLSDVIRDFGCPNELISFPCFCSNTYLCMLGGYQRLLLFHQHHHHHHLVTYLLQQQNHQNPSCPATTTTTTLLAAAAAAAALAALQRC